MKSKLLLLSFIVLSFTTVHSQIKKGSVLLGGSLNFATEKNEGSGTTQNVFSISPAVGKAVRDNLIVGADLTFSTRRVKNSPNISLDEKGYGGGFFVRKYAPLGKSFYLFGQGRVGGEYFRYETNVQPNGPFENRKGYNVSLSFYPGIAYSLSNKLQLEAGLPSFFNMYYSSIDPGNGSRTKGFGVSTALSNAANISIGLRVLLNKKSE